MILFLAGSETWHERFRDAGVRNQLFSFFYMRSMRGKSLHAMLDATMEERYRREKAGEKPLRLFLDSGGFTFINHHGVKPDPKRYFKEFIGFVEETKELWDVVAELDIEDHDSSNDVGVSLEQVASWREELLAVSGRRFHVLPVWHDWRPWEEWARYCEDDRYPYLAFGSMLPLGTKNKLCHQAHRHGKLVHGFAETKIQTDMKYQKTDSCDSSTWLRATKYGGLFVFHANQLRILDHKHKADRRLFRSYFKHNGIDMKKVLDEDQAELTKCSLIAWRNMSERFETIGAHKGGLPWPGPADGPTSQPSSAKVIELFAARSERDISESSGGEKVDPGAIERGATVAVAGVPHSAGAKVMPMKKRLGVDPVTWQISVVEVPNGDCQDVEVAAPESGKQTADELPTSGREQDPTEQAKALKALGYSREQVARMLEAARAKEFEDGQAGDARGHAGGGGRDSAQVQGAIPRGSGMDGLCQENHEPTEPVHEVRGTDSSAAAVPGLQARARGGEVGQVPRAPTPDSHHHGDGPAVEAGVDHADLLPMQAVRIPNDASAEGSSESSTSTKSRPIGDASCPPVPSDTHVPSHSQNRAEGSQGSSTSTKTPASCPSVLSSTQVPAAAGLEVGGGTGAGNSKVRRSLPVVDGYGAVTHDDDIQAGLESLQKLPALGCSSCAISGDCPSYQEGAVCFYTKQFKALPVRDFRAHKAIMEHLLEWDMERTYRALLQERLSAGGMIDPRVSAQLDSFMARLREFEQATRHRPAEVSVHASVSGHAGILSRIFGGAMPAQGTELELNSSHGVIDIDPRQK